MSAFLASLVRRRASVVGLQDSARGRRKHSTCADLYARDGDSDKLTEYNSDGTTCIQFYVLKCRHIAMPIVGISHGDESRHAQLSSAPVSSNWPAVWVLPSKFGILGG